MGEGNPYRVVYRRRGEGGKLCFPSVTYIFNNNVLYSAGHLIALFIFLLLLIPEIVIISNH